MKVKLAGVKFKFKRTNAQPALIWLSGIVHALAAVEKNRAASLLDKLPLLSFGIPAAIDATDCGIACDYVVIDTSDLPELKAARRKVAAAVRLGGMK